MTTILANKINHNLLINNDFFKKPKLASSEEILQRNNTNNKNMQYTVVTLVDGRKIECVEYKTIFDKIVISCN